VSELHYTFQVRPFMGCVKSTSHHIFMILHFSRFFVHCHTWNVCCWGWALHFNFCSNTNITVLCTTREHS